MENVMLIVSFFLGAAWNFFTEINFPGTEMSFAMIACGGVLVALGLRVLMIILSLHFSSSPNVDKE